jgi:hypothetical protein
MQNPNDFAGHLLKTFCFFNALPERQERASFQKTWPADALELADCRVNSLNMRHFSEL